MDSPGVALCLARLVPEPGGDHVVESSFVLRNFSYLRDLVSRDRLLRIPFSGLVMSSNVPASVPPSAGFSLRRFLSGCSRLVVGDGRRLHSPDEEYVGVVLGTCSQMLRIKNKATRKMLSIKVLRPS
jgi:hypothetical protein